MSSSVRKESKPNDKIVNQSKLKAFADDKINIPQAFKFVLGGVENTGGESRKCGLATFSHFPSMSAKDNFLRVNSVW